MHSNNYFFSSDNYPIIVSSIIGFVLINLRSVSFISQILKNYEFFRYNHANR